MHVTVARKDLYEALGIRAVVERRNTIPILSNIALTAEAGTLTIAATDLDILVETRIPATVITPGATTVSAITLGDAVAKFAETGGVEMQADDKAGRLQVRHARSRMSLQTLPIADFPVLDGAPATHRFDFPVGELTRALATVRHAISTEETRYYLNGTHIHASAGHLIFVSTDGHRLARLRIARPDGAEDMPGIILPRKAGDVLARMLKTRRADELALIEVTDAKLRLSVGGLTLLTKLIDGTYPDYERVIPQPVGHAWHIPREALGAALDRVRTVLTGKSKLVALTADAEAGTLTVAAHTSDGASGTESLDMRDVTISGRIGLNVDYLMAALDALTCPSVDMHFVDPGAPALILPAAEDGQIGDDLTQVIMPLRLDGGTV